MIDIEFQGFGKIARLFRDVVITEKIDGSNAAIGIEFRSYQIDDHPDFPEYVRVVDRGGYEVNGMMNLALVYAQSRKRIIHPGSDNFGFAQWVWANAESLVADLCEGLHFGEWWGKGVQRGYGLDEKRFSLFNVKRWEDAEFKTPGVYSVPVLYRGEFSTAVVKLITAALNIEGSYAAPGFDRPEGIIVYHTAANELFKVTLENDEQPKGLVA